MSDHASLDRTARPGTVYLVGAGPGDPGLMTVRGRALLADCDAVVYDALVDIGSHLGQVEGGNWRGAAEREPAELHFVGKRGGDETSARQSDINDLLIRLARDGKAVVRLKGGDPFVFGRGSEEAQALAAAAISFEVIPGVTAGIGAPAYAGIPVTHRGLSGAVTFVTGHEDPTRDDVETDWASLGRAGGTVVLYMAVRRLPTIVRALMGGGMAGNTPAAAIRWGTTSQQETVVATLDTIVDRIEAASLTAPVITVIGRTVALREQIRWFDQPDRFPLRGLRVLVTRASSQPPALSQRLRSLGALVTESPATRIERLDPARLVATLSRLAEYRYLVLTSQSAVRIVWDALREAGLDARALAGVTIAAVGPATAHALLECGIAVDLSPPQFVAEAVLESMRARADLRGARVLYPAAQGARSVLPDGLRESGASVDVIPIYRSVYAGDGATALREIVNAGALDVATFASGAAVRGFVEAVGAEAAIRVPSVTMGPITSEAARSAGLSVIGEAEVSTIDGLVQAVMRSDPR